MNTQIRQLEDNIIATLNDSLLPMEVKRLILLDVISMVTKRADEAIMTELEAQNAESTQ